MNAYQIESLISLVESKKIIYDKRDKMFKDKHAKEKAWQNIAEQLGVIDTEEVKKCWANLHDRFGRERRQRMNIPSGSEAVEFSWPYYEAMVYLEPYILGRKTKLNLTQEPEKTTEVIYASETVSNDENISMEYIAGTLGETVFEDSTSLSAPGPSTLDTTPRTSSSETPTIKRKRRSSSVEQDIMSLQTTLTNVAATLSETNSIDSDMAFGQYVGTRLKEMTKTEKNRAKLKIMEILDGDD